MITVTLRHLCTTALVYFSLLASAHAADLTENRQLVERFYREVFAARNAQAAAGFLRPDYIQHNPHVPQGSAGFIAFFAKVWATPAPPDYAVTVLHLVAENDLVVAQVRWTYTSAGGKKISDEGFDLFRVQDGKLAEHWDAINGS
jgi:predicted SnoaL-like aldol condensation-catalyzing enzyme